MSTPGKQDGLFWRNADGSEGGPISEAVAKAIKKAMPWTSHHMPTATSFRS